MSTSNDTDPENPFARSRATTDPGPGPMRKVSTDPGLAPSPHPEPWSQDEVTSPLPTKTTKGVPLPPPTPPPRPVAMLDPTPVPPEATDALLTGLIEAENEAYFRKAKPASESRGEAAVAFALGPRPLTAANPTPPPEAPVVLRPSMEIDLANLPELPGHPARPAEGPTAAAMFASTPNPWGPEQTIVSPLPKPKKSSWLGPAFAFVMAAGVAAVLALGAARVFAPEGPGDPAASKPSGVATRGTAALAAIPTSVAAPPPVVLPPPVVSSPPPLSPSPVPDLQLIAPPSTAVEPSPVRPPKPVTPRATAASAAPARPPISAAVPGTSAPPPKDDVKRAM